MYFLTFLYHYHIVQSKQRICIVGAGWGGLSAAHALATSSNAKQNLDITLVDASPRVGGLVRDGFTTIYNTTNAKAEAGQHGFWDNYYNIFNFLENELPTISNIDVVF